MNANIATNVRKPPGGLFVAGTNTEVGKSTVCSLLLQYLVGWGADVGAYKPVASGVSSGDSSPASDGSQLHAALESRFEPQLVCPLEFRAPIAPWQAAALENHELTEHQLMDGLARWKDRTPFLVVESAGGLFSPITRKWTSADLAARIDYPILLVVKQELGCGHQLASTLLAAAYRSVKIDAVVFNDCSSQAKDAWPENKVLIEEMASLPYLKTIWPQHFFRIEFNQAKLDGHMTTWIQACTRR
jgi:dethiobiotin synthetase